MVPWSFSIGKLVTFCIKYYLCLIYPPLAAVYFSLWLLAFGFWLLAFGFALGIKFKFLLAEIFYKPSLRILCRPSLLCQQCQKIRGDLQQLGPSLYRLCD